MSTNGDRAPTHERRMHTRHHIDMPLSWWQEWQENGQEVGERVSGRLLDLGIGGLCLRGGHRRPVAKTVVLTLVVDGECFKVEGHVAWASVEHGELVLGIRAPVDGRLLQSVRSESGPVRVSAVLTN